MGGLAAGSDNNRVIRIDASMLKVWDECRESFRRKYVENIVEKKPAIHREFGIAVHRGIEAFWRNLGYEAAFRAATDYALALDQTWLNPQEHEKWEEMVNYLPDVLACYYDEKGSPTQEDAHHVEYEFELDSPSFPRAVLHDGRIDRMRRSAIIDVKTASAVGSAWKENLRKQYLRDIGLAMYDWALSQIMLESPTTVIVEIIVKPYRGSKPRIEEIELPEITTPGYRTRFKQQLRWKTGEITTYLHSETGASPWPMSDGSMCVTKYGECPYLPLCNYGDTAKNLSKYQPRKEHLASRMVE